MEIAEKTKERSTVIFAVLTLVVIGATVLVSTNQTFRHQREAEEQHLYLTSRAVYLSIERSVRRGTLREGEDRLSPRTADFFQAMEQDGDVLFVGIVDELEARLLTSPLHAGTPIELPEGMLDELFRDGEWRGRVLLAQGGAYIYAKRLEPLRGMHMSLRDSFSPPGYLMVGIDMEKHLAAYAGFRKNVIFQTVYILAAALLTWGLGVSFLARREQAKKASVLELFQAKLLDNLPDGLMTIGGDGIVRSANPAALSILRHDSRDILARPVAELPLGFAEKLAMCVGTDRKSTGWQHVHHGRAHLEILCLPLTDDPENAWLVLIRDRTQLRSLEKSLADAEKLAAVGTLAAGVAHEVRNPLSSLRGFAQYFVKKLAGQTPEEEYAKTMVREADRLNRVITDLLFLGRPKPISPQEVDLAALVREIGGLIRFDLEKQAVTLETRLETERVFADPDALKQALLNLVLNSLDALQHHPGAGQLPLFQPDPAEGGWRPDTEPLPLPSNADFEEALEASDAAFSPAAESLVPALPDPFQAGAVLITSGETVEGTWIDVRDKGCGMSAEQRAQAFEAFFTAKERGTGLGLALVQRTMLDHGGSAQIASEPGKGATLRLFFPKARAEETLHAPSALGNNA